ncbi:MAG: LysM peptidoglycan-binding domain-containing protein [Clostridia bacterium]|nr:LysM peptidoglycan-binding domain-containing protein [Clostridia bacterium]
MSLTKITFPYYIVKKGETLKSVSQKFSVPATKILLDNDIAPRDVKEGVLLIIKT